MTLSDTVLSSIENSPAIDTDSYKTSHWMQYPPNTEYVYSYLESRGGQFDEAVMAGVMYNLHQIAGEALGEGDIETLQDLIVPHMGGNPENFNREGWEDIVKTHKGRLPVKIMGIPEGTRIGTKNALMTIVNTDPKHAWLVGHLETALMRMWYPITVASLSYAIRKVILQGLEESGTPEDIDFKLQDFGSRGASSQESAKIGAGAHALVFKGSDTMIALPYLYKYYKTKEMPLFSVPAAEHSTITSWGRGGEVNAYRNMLQKYPDGTVSIVSDSYDIMNACANIYGGELRDIVTSRSGVLVIRPDSGDIIPTILNILNVLAEKFGTSENSKGFRVLPPFLRLLQGDGMNYHTVKSLIRALIDNSWSLDNIACFGMGGKLLQGVDRDTMKFAFKCSAVYYDDQWHEVFKDPITDPGKASKKGLLTVHYDNGEFKTKSSLNPERGKFGNRLVPMFLDGKVLYQEDLDTIRKRVRQTDYAIPIDGAGSLK